MSTYLGMSVMVSPIDCISVPKRWRGKKGKFRTTSQEIPGLRMMPILLYLLYGEG